MRRRAIVAWGVVAITMAMASTALAGGWAVTTVDSMPEEFEAGTTYTIEYTIRQHGKTPVDSGASHVMLRQPKTGESLRFHAENHGDGTYSVEVTVPREGSWEWEAVSEWWGTQHLGTIEVAAPGATAGFDASDALKVILPLATLIAALLTFRLGRVGGPERPPPRPDDMNRALLGLTPTLLLATASVFVYSTEETGAAAAIDGRTLFQAKSCLGRHQRGDLGQLQIGPDLTGLVSRAATRVEGLSAEEYVRQSVREPQTYILPGHPNIEMPALPLTDAELDALVQFLLEADV